MRHALTRTPFALWTAVGAIGAIAVGRIAYMLAGGGGATTFEIARVAFLLLFLGVLVLALLADRRRIDQQRSLADRTTALEDAARDGFFAAVMAAREAEARRVAELLHDDAIQELSALGLRLELEGLRSGNDRLPELARSANRIAGSLRLLLVELHPAVLESQGLVAAIEAGAETLRDRGVDVRVEGATGRFEPEAEQLVFRLVQEALANILQHADAANVIVRLQCRDDIVRCEVIDDGRGFDPSEQETALSRGRIGLRLARERLEHAGGRLLLRSTAGEGSQFAFELTASRTSPREATG